MRCHNPFCLNDDREKLTEVHQWTASHIHASKICENLQIVMSEHTLLLLLLYNNILFIWMCTFETNNKTLHFLLVHRELSGLNVQHTITTAETKHILQFSVPGYTVCSCFSIVDESNLSIIIIYYLLFFFIIGFIYKTI